MFDSSHLSRHPSPLQLTWLTFYPHELRLALVRLNAAVVFVDTWWRSMRRVRDHPREVAHVIIRKVRHTCFAEARGKERLQVEATMTKWCVEGHRPSMPPDAPIKRAKPSPKGSLEEKPRLFACLRGAVSLFLFTAFSSLSSAVRRLAGVHYT